MDSPGVASRLAAVRYARRSGCASRGRGRRGARWTRDRRRRSGRSAPRSRSALVRCILDSLAAANTRAIREATRLSGVSPRVVHVIGGGSQNRLLCQLTADACGLTVVAGPVEATAIGNVLVQARARGMTTGDLDALRA